MNYKVVERIYSVTNFGWTWADDEISKSHTDPCGRTDMESMNWALVLSFSAGEKDTLGCSVNSGHKNV